MIEQNQWFYFVGGKSAKDLDELVSALKEIHNDEFVFHVNSAKNDFANWVEGVFGYSDLANDLRHVMERRDTLAIIKRFLHRKKALLPGFSREELAEPKPAEHKSTALAVEMEITPPMIRPEKKVTRAPDIDFSQSLDMVTHTIEEDVKKNAPNPSFTAGEEIEIEPGELKVIADEVTGELHIESRAIDDVPKSKATSRVNDDHHHRFIVKEFIYGFLVGLIFGLVMLGALMNVRT